MRKLTQLLLLVVLFFAASQSAKASLLVEPLVGFNLGSKIDIKDDDNKGNYTGMGGAYGGRLGYQKLGFQMGVDYLHSSIDFSGKDFKTNTSLNEWAGFVGFEFPVLLRVYAGYIFSATGESKYLDKNDVKQSLDLKSGSGAKFGIGFTGLPFVVINLEYRAGSIDDYKLGSTRYENDKMKYSSYLLSLSLPLNF